MLVHSSGSTEEGRHRAKEGFWIQKSSKEVGFAGFWLIVSRTMTTETELSLGHLPLSLTGPITESRYEGHLASSRTPDQNSCPWHCHFL